MRFQGRVDNEVLAYKGIVGLAGETGSEIVFTNEKPADEHHGYDNAEHTEGVGDSRGEGCAATADADMLEGCLRRTEGGGVRRGTAQDTYHVGKFDAGEECHDDGHDGSEDDDG